MYQAAPLVSFVLVAFRVLQRWIIEFRVARGENIIDPGSSGTQYAGILHPGKCRSTRHRKCPGTQGIDNRINTIKNSNEEER